MAYPFTGTPLPLLNSRQHDDVPDRRVLDDREPVQVPLAGFQCGAPDDSLGTLRSWPKSMSGPWVRSSSTT
jgi:hypothetical protein